MNDILDRANHHLRQLAPHVKERDTGMLMQELVDMLERQQYELFNLMDLARQHGGSKTNGEIVMMLHCETMNTDRETAKKKVST